MSDQSISTVSLSSDDETIQTITLTASDQSWQTGTISSSNTFPSNNKHSSIHATGDVIIEGGVIIEGDLKIQGESIKDLLEEIKDKLSIFKPNTELEERWETLRELRRQYLKLEKDILEKEEIIRILKR
jgi:hypothetical protein